MYLPASTTEENPSILAEKPLLGSQTTGLATFPTNLLYKSAAVQGLNHETEFL
jgi:hypothetical protein